MRVFAKHLLAFLLPALTLTYLVTAPHAWFVPLGYLAFVGAMFAVDTYAGPARHDPDPDVPAWPFDLALLALVALQLASVALALRFAARVSVLSLEYAVGALLVALNSASSAIVVAHELVHRKEKPLAFLGRVLLATVLYDHFHVEHVRGHHARIGTAADAATARYGERFGDFWRRSVPAQFRSAWRLEAKRLGDEGMPWHDPRNLRNAVLHGVVAELGLLVVVAWAFGPAAFGLFVVQAWGAVKLLEVVNYFEHWGLVRTGRKVRPVDSWDSDSWFTLYALVGLSRHADHHAYASRPYQALRTWEASPKLPRGYLGMVLLVLAENDRAMHLLDAELARKRLGPYAAVGEPPPDADVDVLRPAA